MLKAVSSFATDSGLAVPAGHVVDYDAQRGSAAMPCGSLAMHVDGERVSLAIDSADEEQLAKLKYVVNPHIVRFAFRESSSQQNSLPAWERPSPVRSSAPVELLPRPQAFQHSPPAVGNSIAPATLCSVN